MGLPVCALCTDVPIIGIGHIPWQHLHDLVQNQALRQVRLGNNKFTEVGAIPPIVCEMTKLEVLTLHALGFAGGCFGCVCEVH